MTETEIQTNMFQGVLHDGTPVFNRERIPENYFMQYLTNIHNYIHIVYNNAITMLTSQNSSVHTVIKCLNIHSIKLSKKGRLGSYLYEWTSSDAFTVDYLDILKVGCIQLKCNTVPGDYNISVFFFFPSCKIKVCGKLLDKEVSQAFSVFSKGQTESEIDKETEDVDTGLNMYYKDITSILEIIFQVKFACIFTPSLLTGQFNYQCYIHNCNDIAIHAMKFPDLFDSSNGQEPEINGRMFAVQLYIKSASEKNLHISFDHYGKVQIFNATSFSDMVYAIKIFLKFMDICITDKITKTEVLSQKPKKKNKVGRPVRRVVPLSPEYLKKHKRIRFP